jgi:Serine/Threonine/Tyrosine Kinase found in polyvalent proteins
LTRSAVSVRYGRELSSESNEPSRISEEARGRIARDSIKAAAYYLRAGTPPSGESSRASSSFRIQSLQLFCWARDNDKVVADTYVPDLVDAGALVYEDEGAEHIVYHDEANKRAVKVTRPGLGDILEYLDSLSNSNDLFGDDVFILGVFGPETSPRIIISQKWIAEEENVPDITREAIDAYFENLRFERLILDGSIVYYNADTKILARDAHAGNFMRFEGRLVPIDVNVQEVSTDLPSFENLKGTS